MYRDKLAALTAVAILAVGYCHDAIADGLPKSGLLPIGEVAKAGSWSGFYVGGHVGYGWSGLDGSMIYTDAKKGDGFDASGKTLDADGAIAGGMLGFNLQTGNVVWGIEADASWAGIEGNTTLKPYPASKGAPDWAFNSKIEWLATVRARLGFTSGRTLVYGTGGVAFSGIETSHDVIGKGYSAWGNKSENAVGWTVGGGFEWLLSDNWTMRAEYLYYRFDDVGGILAGEQSTSCKVPCAHTTDGFGGDLDLHTTRIGFSYKFGK